MTSKAHLRRTASPSQVPARGPRPRRMRPFLEVLEGRCLLSGQPPLFDAPWRGFDTGTFPEAFGPGALAAADLDADGDPDVVVGQSYFGGPGASVLFNRGDGTYHSPVHYRLPSNATVGEVAAADLDADGDPDVLATVPGSNYQLSTVALWRNRGDGTLAPREEFPTGRA